MKTLRKVNTIAFYTTLALFITVYLGMLAEIPLGIIQVSSAFLLTFNIKNNSVQAIRKLKLYWFLVFMELALFLLNEFYFNFPGDEIGFIVVVFLPMAIAIYFFIIMKKITDEYELKQKES